MAYTGKNDNAEAEYTAICVRDGFCFNFKKIIKLKKKRGIKTCGAPLCLVR
jgi:hypothetical protein